MLSYSYKLWLHLPSHFHPKLWTLQILTLTAESRIDVRPAATSAQPVRQFAESQSRPTMISGIIARIPDRPESNQLKQNHNESFNLTIIFHSLTCFTVTSMLINSILSNKVMECVKAIVAICNSSGATDGSHLPSFWKCKQ